MGIRVNIKFVAIGVLFFLTSVIVYWPTAPQKGNKLSKLDDYFIMIDGYQIGRKIPLRNDLFQMLKLDDYIFNDYEGPDGRVNLYIGYYYSANKAYASHSPLVCYPSQGWKIETKPTRAVLKIDEYTINYEEVITSLGKIDELVLYWYQSHLDTNTIIYRNKIDMGLNKIRYNDEHHGFIRVTTTIYDDNYEEAKSRAFDFIAKFYPKFIDFIKED